MAYSFLSNIKHIITIGKVIGIVFFPANPYEKTRAIDYCYFMPVAFTFLYCSYQWYTSILFLLEEGTTQNFCVRFFVILCDISSVEKWINFFRYRQEFRRILLQINEIVVKSEHGLILSRKAINKRLHGVMIAIYLLVTVSTNLYGQYFWVFYISFGLSLEMAVYEQYFIYNITQELYLQMKFVNNYFKFVLRKAIKGNLRDEFATKYKEYKYLLELARATNRVFQFSTLSTLNCTFLGLGSSYYMFHLSKKTDPMFYVNILWFTTINVRLFFMVYN